MAFVKTLLVLGLAAVSPFSMAQEIVVPGNNNAPYQPPAWFVRMAKPEAKFPEPIDGFLVDSRTSFPRVVGESGIKYPCLKSTDEGKFKWQFCDM